MKFTGERAAFQALVDGLGFQGNWGEQGTKVVYRCDSGPVINWWPSSKKKTVSVQGGGDANGAVLAAVATAPGGGGPLMAAEATGATYVAQPPQSKVFVVHGHDQAARDQLELFIHRLGLDPFVLQDSGGAGMTIIEALEESIVADAPTFGIVLMTPDDVGYAKAAGEDAAQPRARQNVVLEMGMLIARLGRGRVAILKKGHLEQPSDAAGILHLGFNDHVNEVSALIIKRLRDAGFEFSVDVLAKASR